MNIFIQNYYKILEEWHNLKENLKRQYEIEKDPKNVLNKIKNFFQLAPISSIVFDYEDQNTWMTPWELLKFNEYDLFSKTYIIAETYEMILKNNCEIYIAVKNNLQFKDYFYVFYDIKNHLVLINNDELKIDKDYDIFSNSIRVYKKENKKWKKIY